MYKFNGGNGAIVCDKCRTIIIINLSPSTYRLIRVMLGQYQYELSESPPDSELDLCTTCEDNSSQAPTASLGEENE